MNGKGDRPRPLAVSREQYEANWEACFGKSKPKRSKPKPKVASPSNSAAPDRHAPRT